MKKLINTLKWLIYHKTDVYVMDEIHYSDLHYSLFFLHRVDRLFGFKIHRCIDKATSLYPSNIKPSQWIYSYFNLKTNKVILK